MFLHTKIVCSTHITSEKTEGGNLGDLTSELQTYGYLGTFPLQLRGSVISFLLL